MAFVGLYKCMPQIPDLLQKRNKGGDCYIEAKNKQTTE
jgi:hypothetical protein